MKKGEIIIALVALFSIFSVAGVHAAIGCDLQVSLVNQDPYPAIPGEEAKLVFQLDGLENPLCGDVSFQLIPKYPLTLMPNQPLQYNISGGTFQKDYKSFFLAPYNVLVSSDALDGDNAIEVRYKQSTDEGWESKQFNLNVEDVRANFEVYVKNYDPSTKAFTLEVLNIAKSNVKALTVQIPKQSNIVVKGANTNIVGDLDSNDYTTADFEATPQAGNITVELSYTDKTNERRTIEKTISFDPQYFEGLTKDQKSSPVGKYILYGAIIALIVYYFYRRNKKKKEMQKKLRK
jgi:hypothetical protein